MNNYFKEKALEKINISVLLVFLILIFIPIFLMVSFSLRTYNQIAMNFWSLPESFIWKNYATAFSFIYRQLINSIFVAAVTASGTVLLAAINGYVFGVLNFAGKKVLFLLVIMLMMVPSILTLTPQYLQAKSMGLTDTWFALWLPYIAWGQVMATIVCKTFIENQAKDLFEAARIDGATELTCLLRISMPLCKPILATLAISSLMGCYNDYVWPLLMINSDARQLLIVKIAMLTSSTDTRYYTVQIAGYVISSIPLFIIFLFGMRNFVEGISSGALKV